MTIFTNKESYGFEIHNELTLSRSLCSSKMYIIIQSYTEYSEIHY
jgi:hypothetical protein